jgi:hypothetical protein
MSARSRSLPDWELWAAAHAVLARHGDEAARFAQQRIAALESAADVDGARAWRAIAARCAALSEIPSADRQS